MNYIWPLMVIVSFIFSILNGRLDETLASAFLGAQSAVEAVVGMAGMFCFWSGLLNLAEKSGFSQIISRVVNPILKLIFPKLSGKALSHITMNVVANLMGMGNAATPAGIAAMTELDKQNHHSLYASDEMCLFVVMNTASIQLIPTTILSLRAANGSVNPAAVIIPIWIVSSISLTLALIFTKIIIFRGRKR